MGTTDIFKEFTGLGVRQKQTVNNAMCYCSSRPCAPKIGGMCSSLNRKAGCLLSEKVIFKSNPGGIGRFFPQDERTKTPLVDRKHHCRGMGIVQQGGLGSILGETECWWEMEGVARGAEG